ncbi:hypothetical protein [Streptomyces sp. LN590]|uniref:hypothetical protein n=1 Tax=Streptomyces sp. LN590 TaxID=3112980 RepID=UPI003717CA8B
MDEVFGKGKAEADAGERHDRLTTDELEEPAQLRREMSQLHRVNEVQRTASAFSPRGSTRPGPGDRAPSGLDRQPTFTRHDTDARAYRAALRHQHALGIHTGAAR